MNQDPSLLRSLLLAAQAGALKLGFAWPTCLGRGSQPARLERSGAPR
jgi:hypothetical protein